MTNAKIAEILDNAAEHYKRMLNGIYDNIPNLPREPDMMEFKKVVGETWSSADCPLCKAFHHSVPDDNRCDGCPVHEFFGGCNKTPHHYMAYAKSWGEWIDAAQMEYNLLQLLYSYYIERAQNDTLSFEMECRVIRK